MNQAHRARSRPQRSPARRSRLSLVGRWLEAVGLLGMMQTLVRPVGLAPSLRLEESTNRRRSPGARCRQPCRASPVRAQGRAPALRWVQPCRGSPARQEASRPAPAARAAAPPPLPPGAWPTHSGPQALSFWPSSAVSRGFSVAMAAQTSVCCPAYFMRCRGSLPASPGQYACSCAGPAPSRTSARAWTLQTPQSLVQATSCPEWSEGAARS